MIYCVEDDNSIRELMIYTLQASGFEACGFRDGDSFWEMLKDKKPELVILDIMLPGEDGISILKKLRLSPTTEDIPVIMATAKNSEYDTVIGLDSGADDYLAKPFGMMEMVSRIKAVLRRSNPGNKAGEIRCGSIVIDEGKHTVKVDGKPVSLTLKEYELLKLMMENAGHVFTRDILLTSIWGVDYVGETRTVDVHIGTLRTKLDECGDMIKTVRGVGYKMEGQDNE
ncbi:response regulator [Eubacterium ruminantium]|uniref:response regulator n=1 Tax=Eubacterium ruminantium TaxID=42322 RepID=UPI0024783D11|nr:response regulator transcription factor [Eubacterium ruminantium]